MNMRCFLPALLFPIHDDCAAMFLQIHELFELFDGDGDGRVSADDFMSCLRRNPLLIALFSHCLRHDDSLEDSDRTPDEIV